MHSIARVISNSSV